MSETLRQAIAYSAPVVAAFIGAWCAERLYRRRARREELATIVIDAVTAAQELVLRAQAVATLVNHEASFPTRASRMLGLEQPLDLLATMELLNSRHDRILRVTSQVRLRQDLELLEHLRALTDETQNVVTRLTAYPSTEFKGWYWRMGTSSSPDLSGVSCAINTLTEYAIRRHL